jgi:hypothetical protein
MIGERPATLSEIERRIALRRHVDFLTLTVIPFQPIGEQKRKRVSYPRFSAETPLAEFSQE